MTWILVQVSTGKPLLFASPFFDKFASALINAKLIKCFLSLSPAIKENTAQQPVVETDFC